MLFVNSGLQYWVGDLDFLCVGAKQSKSADERTSEYIYISGRRKKEPDEY